MLYTNSGDIPPPISAALADSSIFNGAKLSHMLTKVVKVLDKAIAGSEESEEEEEDMGFDVSDEDWSTPSPKRHLLTGDCDTRTPSGDRSAISALNTRIRSDLRAAKAAGFRISHLGSLLNYGQDSYVSISCRVKKLCISDEALQAWHLAPDQYIVLLLHYTNGYTTLEHLTEKHSPQAARSVQMRLGSSQRYKIGLCEAIDAFSKVSSKDSQKQANTSSEVEGTGLGNLHDIFISGPINELLNERLAVLSRFRLKGGLSWNGAEKYFIDNPGKNIEDDGVIHETYYIEDQSRLAATLPKIVTADHLTESSKPQSFPLIAMQFALRHLVRCTEFCLVCHRQVETDFEALKPYVCSNPLCLYQYMALGFGPSIEYEILSQPHVVDLLISFCYSSASCLNLASLPTGMGLMVPKPLLLVGPAILSGPVPVFKLPQSTVRFPNGDLNDVSHLNEDMTTNVPTIYKAEFDQERRELILPPGSKVLRSGDWIYMTNRASRVPSQTRDHYRVIEALHPTIRLGEPIRRPQFTDQVQDFIIETKPLQGPTPAATPPLSTTDESSSYPEVDFIIYDQKFDELSNQEKQISIATLLQTLPSVKDMQDFLRKGKGKMSTLRDWRDRISPAARDILRWIIASNRSCIIQVDKFADNTKKSEERVFGMPQWMQFRFAQGAPDKEQRFITSVRDTAARLHLNYPTIFAWHGSPVYNWHGIVREGLHFEKALHGRAFGHGVYHALDVNTSISYSNAYRQTTFSDQTGSLPRGWTQSLLNISETVVLNEIVNAPAEFVSKAPHLVVAQLDWIQSRYLFVKCRTSDQIIPERAPTEVFTQDPDYVAMGINRSKLIIPITVVSRSRRPASKTVKNGKKKIKIGSQEEIEEDAIQSDDTDIEDMEIFFSDSEITMQQSKSTGKAKEENGSLGSIANQLTKVAQTDFIPGCLDHKTLPLLDEPSYATPGATRSLHAALRETLKEQKRTPAHELGWYINGELISNVYQWIVEFHSFEAHLPIAKDMKERGLKSVVMEIRFGKDFPMSPPFVRVIRPRFKTFLQGGGGHVTAGGALCMELLTNSGWSAVQPLDKVLMQVRVAITSTEPQPARLEKGLVSDYGVGEAVEAYIRACRAHGVC